MKMRDAHLQVYEKNSFKYSSSCIFPSFLRTLHDYFFRRGFESVRAKYKQKVVLLVICLLNYDSSTSTSFMLNVAFDVVLGTVFVKYIGIYCDTKITETFFFSQPVCFVCTF